MQAAQWHLVHTYKHRNRDQPPTFTETPTDTDPPGKKWHRNNTKTNGPGIDSLCNMLVVLVVWWTCSYTKHCLVFLPLMHQKVKSELKFFLSRATWAHKVALDLHFHSTQPDNSFYCEMMNTWLVYLVCLIRRDLISPVPNSDSSWRHSGICCILMISCVYVCWQCVYDHDCIMLLQCLFFSISSDDDDNDNSATVTWVYCTVD